MEKTDYECMTTPEKVQYLYEKLNKLKPECFVEEPNQPLGDFWVNLKEADNFYWSEYAYEDFVVGLWYCDPNHSHYSGSACDRGVAFPAIDKDVIPGDASQWTFGERDVKPEWFTDENIQEGNIWVKLLCVHDASEDNEDDD